MKILIGTDGPVVTARIAREFAKAAWYLIVDSETSDVIPMRHLSGGHQRVVRAADEQGVSVVIVHCIGGQAFDAVSGYAMMVACADTISARNAVDLLMRGELTMLDAPAGSRINDAPVSTPGRSRKEHTRGPRAKGVVAPVKATPRGQHHLQQYGGRGH